jgi:hypothetical protein
LNDRAAFIRIAVRLAQDAELRARLRNEARRVAEGASWNRAFDELERVLRNTARARRSGAVAVREESAHVET